MRMMSIASGSSGNCIYIGDDTTHILIDAGISGKRIENGLQLAGITPKELDGIFVTHEHSDHISGLGVLSRKYNIPIYATAGTVRGIQTCRSVGMIDSDLYQIIDRHEISEVGSLKVEAHPVSHDAQDPVCYRVSSQNNSVAVATDMGCYDESIVAFLTGLDAILLESNHDINMLMVGGYPYPLKQRILSEKGHLCNEAAGQLLGRILHDKIKRIWLGHLSRENNLPQLAEEAVRLEVSLGENPYRADDFDIRVASREEPGDLLELV
ncbi:MAG: MBL fold metallo-hydrolase [Lachnospiraceae bacterium]|nr:MBL fold metallo-hydrolase [Lachnospiraceae bacterium]